MLLQGKFEEKSLKARLFCALIWLLAPTWIDTQR